MSGLIIATYCGRSVYLTKSYAMVKIINKQQRTARVGLKIFKHETVLLLCCGFLKIPKRKQLCGNIVRIVFFFVENVRLKWPLQLELQWGGIFQFEKKMRKKTKSPAYTNLFTTLKLYNTVNIYIANLLLF